MMARVIRGIFAITLAALLAACAAPLKKVDASPQAMDGIKTVAVIRPPELPRYELLNLGSPLNMFGAVGGALSEAERSSKKEQLAKVYQEHKVAISDAIAQSVAKRLADLGFATTIEDAPWTMVEGVPSLPPEKVQSKADAIVIIYPAHVGFVAAGLQVHNNDYLPHLAIAVSIRGKDRQQIYRGYHLTGWKLPNEGWRYTEPTVFFPDFDSLVKKPEASSRALIDAADKVAISLGRDLQRQLKLKGSTVSASAGDMSATAFPEMGKQEDSASAILRSDRIRDAYQRYVDTSLPKAFAISEDGRRWWTAKGLKPKNPGSDRDPALRAVPDCEAHHHVKCVLYAVDNQVVYQAQAKAKPPEQSAAKAGE